MEIADKLSKEIETKLEQMLNEGFNNENIDKMYKLVDIHKDIENEKYWKEKIMRYRESYNEDSYGRRGVPGSGRGRYRDGSYSESYGRRGVPGTGRYRGEEGDIMLDDMYGNYQAYSEGKEAYNRGNYGAKEDSMKSLQYMLQAMEDFGMYLMEDADSEEERNMIKQTLKKMSDK